MGSSTLATSLLTFFLIVMALKHINLFSVNRQCRAQKYLLLSVDLALLLQMINFYLWHTQKVFSAPAIILVSGFCIYLVGAIPFGYLILHLKSKERGFHMRWLLVSAATVLGANVWLNDTDLYRHIDYFYLGIPIPKILWLYSLQLALNVVLSLTGIRLIHRLSKQMEHEITSVENYNLRWLKAHFHAVPALSLIVLLFDLKVIFLGSPLYPTTPSLFFMFLLCLLLLIPAAGCVEQAPLTDLRLDLQEPASEAPEKATQEEKEALKPLLSRLEQLIEEKQYFLDADLRLSSLAEKSGIPPYQVSKSINLLRGKNFNEFINDFRIQLAKEHLVSEKFRHFTILAIALDCGYKSKSSFNSHFKKRTEMTPQEYRSQNSPNGYQKTI